MRSPCAENSRRQGATTVESALVISIAILFIFGIMEYARLVYFFHVADHAVREGARYASVHTGDGTTTAQLTSFVTNAMAGTENNLSNFKVDIFNANPSTGAKISSNWTDAPFTGAIGVEISGDFRFIVPNVIFLSSATIPVRLRSLMTSESN